MLPGDDVVTTHDDWFDKQCMKGDAGRSVVCMAVCLLVCVLLHLFFRLRRFVIFVCKLSTSSVATAGGDDNTPVFGDAPIV